MDVFLVATIYVEMKKNSGGENNLFSEVKNFFLLEEEENSETKTFLNGGTKDF